MSPHSLIFAKRLYPSLSQVVDLGSPAHSHANARGCSSQHAACPGGCGMKGHCVGGLRHPRCECEPGWAGPACASPTTPARFDAASYLKVALSFLPGPWVVKVQVRVRLHGARTGLLVQLAAHHGTAALTLHVRLTDALLRCCIPHFSSHIHLPTFLSFCSS